jgi:ankyrin repeat protein
LHQAASENHKETAELLITKGADLNAKSDWGSTPRDVANSRRRRTVAAVLRKHGGKTGEELKAAAN